jgi:hypothetical protein
VHFENKNIFFYLEKRSCLLQHGVVVVNSQVVGLAPRANPTTFSYTASVVKILPRNYLIAWRVFIMKIIFILRNYALAYYNTTL